MVDERARLDRARSKSVQHYIAIMEIQERERLPEANEIHTEDSKTAKEPKPTSRLFYIASTPAVSTGSPKASAPAKTKSPAATKTGTSLFVEPYILMIGASSPKTRLAVAARASPVPRTGVGKTSGA
jgi:hypothetical protein